MTARRVGPAGTGGASPPPADATVELPAVPAAPPADATVELPAVPAAPGGRSAGESVVDEPDVDARAGSRAARRPAPTVPAPPVGQAPAVLALSSLGVVLVAVAYQRARTGAAGAEALYWIGHAVVFVPVAARLLARRLAGAGEAFLLVLGLAVCQYLLKVMYSPDQLKFPDELQHWLATTMLLDTGRLFEPNPALPVAESFPGLAEAGAAVAALTGLPVTTSALIVAGLCRLVFVGALFALVRRAGGSARLAALTCVVYATGQHYLFFNAMYLYQAAALPFLALAVWAACALRRGPSLGAAAVGAASVAVVTVSHHLAAAVLVVALAALALAGFLGRGRGAPQAGRVGSGRRSSGRWGPAALAAFALATVAAWLAGPARPVFDYFEAPARRALESLSGLFGGGRAADPTGWQSPAWQLPVQALALLVLLFLLLKAVRTALRTRQRDPWWWAVLAGGLLFFGGTLLWFAGPQGPELAGRAATFTFLPMSVVAAAELIRRRRLRPARAADRAAARRGWRTQLVAGTAVLSLLLVSARAGGWPPWWGRLPGPHLVGAFERSVDRQGVLAASWTGDWLGAGHRIAADTTGWILLATYGRQNPVAGQAAPLYYADGFGLADARLLDQLSIEYLWVDLRMSRQTPVTGGYFGGDPRAGEHTSPVPADHLTKFGELPGVNLVYDSGDIRIYDVRDL